MVFIRFLLEINMQLSVIIKSSLSLFNSQVISHLLLLVMTPNFTLTLTVEYVISVFIKLFSQVLVIRKQTYLLYLIHIKTGSYVSKNIDLV